MKISIWDYSITDTTKREQLTKGRVWGGIGPDPYPGKDWDDVVMAGTSAASWRLDGHTDRPLNYGEIIEFGGKSWTVTEASCVMTCGRTVTTFTAKIWGGQIVWPPANSSDTAQVKSARE